jgi:hypothetical protein
MVYSVSVPDARPTSLAASAFSPMLGPLLGRGLPGLRHPYSGGRNSPESHPVVSDLIGSGTITVFMKLHFEHSNVRFSW